MNACAAPGCGQPAVLQWQRAGTDTEIQAHHGGLRDVQLRLVNHTRESAGLDVLEHRARLARVHEAAEAGDVDAKRLLPAARRALRDAEAREAAVVDPPAPLAKSEPVTVAVFACETHAVDVEAAAGLHEADCMSDGTCSCSQ